MKGNKARGPDGIVIEMIKALDDFGIEKLTIMANEIYDTGKIPQDLSKSIFIALPKKPGTIECELHRTISLMSHITQVILRVIMMRAPERFARWAWRARGGRGDIKREFRKKAKDKRKK